MSETFSSRMDEAKFYHDDKICVSLIINQRTCVFLSIKSSLKALQIMWLLIFTHSLQLAE